MFQDNSTDSQFDMMSSPINVDSPDVPSQVAMETPRQERVFVSPKKVAKKRKIANEDNDTLVHGALSLLQAIQSNQGKKEEKDEYTLFGEQVAMKIRKIVSPQARFTVQTVINQTLFQAEMGFFNGHNNHPHHSPTYNFPPNTPFATSSYTAVNEAQSPCSTPTYSSYSPFPQSVTPSPYPSPSRTPPTPTPLSVANTSVDLFLNDL